MQNILHYKKKLSKVTKNTSQSGFFISNILVLLRIINMFSPLICVLSYLYFMSPLPRQENVSTKVANLNPCDVSYSHLKLVSIILGHPVYHKIKMQNILPYKKLSKVTKNIFPIWIIYFLHIFKFLFL